MLELRIAGPADEAAARRVEDAVLAEFDRIEALLTVHRPDSALVRWRSGAVDDPGDEVVAVLDEAARWWRLGQGALHPATGAMTASWRRAERVGRVPDDADLDALAGAARSLPYEVVDGHLARTGDTSGVDLNALAKGWIVDRAVEVGRRLDGVSRLVVNAGGDLVHAGDGELTVAIEHPDRPHHNGAPLDRVSISNEALATSGSSHRGFRVAGRWYGHVLDPRTARPVDRVRAALLDHPEREGLPERRAAAVAEHQVAVRVVVRADVGGRAAQRHRLVAADVADREVGRAAARATPARRAGPARSARRRRPGG